ncbi:hypothetical protein SLEP1_g32139 [Rubroshorea leprosula]|uniref:Uncharacterized protein n=1 Tax=Rubroshorea leprosula TaxID=152421 RepID=A0AAV5KCC4_9ROSI|nr:hypothetical protein SLEP1_g32139 [Rubroshorea leprosula]
MELTHVISLRGQFNLDTAFSSNYWLTIFCFLRLL